MAWVVARLAAVCWCCELPVCRRHEPDRSVCSVELGMRIFSTTLETMVGFGHSWEAVSFLMLGASVRGSSAYTESGGASLGCPSSRNSPGQMVLEVGGECRTIAWRAVELIVTGC